jgi:hypothetical protein
MPLGLQLIFLGFGVIIIIAACGAIKAAFEIWQHRRDPR